MFIDLLIHYAFNPTHKSRAMRRNTAPDHNGSSTMLDCLLEVVWVWAVSIATPAPWASIQPKTINFHLVWPYYTLPVINSLILMTFGELEMSLDIFWWKHWLRLFLHSSKTSLMQGITHCIITGFYMKLSFKFLPYFYTCFWATWGNFAYTETFILWWQLRWMTTRRCGEVWEMLCSDFLDLGLANMVLVGNCANTISFLKQRKDIVIWISWERMHEKVYAERRCMLEWAQENYWIWWFFRVMWIG